MMIDFQRQQSSIQELPFSFLRKILLHMKHLSTEISHDVLMNTLLDLSLDSSLYSNNKDGTGRWCPPY